MKTTKVGRFTVTVELDKIEHTMKYYDAVLSKDNKVIKIHTGCIGEKSGEYWGSKLEQLALKLNILNDSLENASDSEKEFISNWINELI
jgi:hypothetical protein